MKIITIIIFSNPVGETFFCEDNHLNATKITLHEPFHQWVNTGWKCVLSPSFQTAVNQSSTWNVGQDNGAKGGGKKKKTVKLTWIKSVPLII